MYMYIIFVRIHNVIVHVHVLSGTKKMLASQSGLMGQQSTTASDDPLPVCFVLLRIATGGFNSIILFVHKQWRGRAWVHV